MNDWDKAKIDDFDAYGYNPIHGKNYLEERTLPAYAEIDIRVSQAALEAEVIMEPDQWHDFQEAVRARMVSPSGRIQVRHPTIQNMSGTLAFEIEKLWAQGYSEIDVMDYLKKATGKGFLTQQEWYAINNLKQEAVRKMGSLKEVALRIGLAGNAGYVSERAAAQFMLTEAARTLAKYEKFPEVDPCSDGNVIRFDCTFPQNPEAKWSYAGIKVEGKYYITGGKTNPQGYTWPELVDWLRDRVQWIAIYSYERMLVGENPDATPMPAEPVVLTKDDVLFPGEKLEGEVVEKTTRPIKDNPQA